MPSYVPRSRFGLPAHRRRLVVATFLAIMGGIGRAEELRYGDLLTTDLNVWTGVDTIFAPAVVVLTQDDFGYPATWTLTRDGFLHRPAGIARQSSQSILVADRNLLDGRGGIVQIDAVTGQQSIFADGNSNVLNPFSEPTDVLVGRHREVFVVDERAHGGSIFVIDKSNRTPHAIATGGYFVRPRSAVLDHDGQSLLVVDPGSWGTQLPVAGEDGPGAIIRVDVATGTQSVVSQGGLFQNPVDLSWGPLGELYVVDPRTEDDTHHGVLLRVEAITGQQSIARDLSELSSAPQAILGWRDMPLLIGVGISDLPDTAGIYQHDPTDASNHGYLLGGGPFDLPQGLALFVPEPSAVLQVWVAVALCSLYIIVGRLRHTGTCV